MKSILFEINNNDIQCLKNEDSETKNDFEYVIVISLPLFSAFSVEYFSVVVDNQSVPCSIEKNIKGGNIRILSEYSINEQYEVTVMLYYHGIRDYSLLFPWIEGEQLRQRIGYYHEEADKNFESGAWFSFSVMCGAIFEGILYAKGIQGDRFYDKIQNAFREGLLTERQKEIFDLVRKYRNALHSNLYEVPLITRKDAMDIKNTLNMIIKSFSSR